jgi:hypothetical protein
LSDGRPGTKAPARRKGTVGLYAERYQHWEAGSFDVHQASFSVKKALLKAKNAY